jgi:hypothetical protein
MPLYTNPLFRHGLPESRLQRGLELTIHDLTAIKLRKKLPLLLERVGVRRIKIRQKALFDPLILTFSLREKGLSILNLMAVIHGLDTRFPAGMAIFLYNDVC